MHSIGQENSSLLPLNKQEYIMVSRRNMLKTGLTAVFGACAVQTASASEVQQKSQNNFDVVILGAGTGPTELRSQHILQRQVQQPVWLQG